MLDLIFNRKSDPDRPPTLIRARALERALSSSAPEGGVESHVIGDPEDPDASYYFRNCLDGKTFELGVYSRQPDGKVHTSYVSAERTGMNAFEITAIVLDNQPEKLDNEKEIRAALDFIGDQVRNIFVGRLPYIHSPYGKFSGVGRLITRLLPRPDEPPGLGL